MRDPHWLWMDWRMNDLVLEVRAMRDGGGAGAWMPAHRLSTVLATPERKALWRELLLHPA